MNRRRKKYPALCCVPFPNHLLRHTRAPLARETRPPAGAARAAFSNRRCVASLVAIFIAAGKTSAGAATLGTLFGVIMGAALAFIVDDVIATGGTAAACAELIRRQGGEVAACLFVLELTFLNGRDAIAGIEARSHITC